MLSVRTVYFAGATAGPNIDGISIVPTLMGRTQPPKEYHLRVISIQTEILT
eukprot:COSAG01_NODE_7072_length_3367_cov_2.824051_3_plen_51_part_00